jgi:hypothetical protein
MTDEAEWTRIRRDNRALKHRRDMLEMQEENIVLRNRIEELEKRAAQRAGRARGDD